MRRDQFAFIVAVCAVLLFLVSRPVTSQPPQFGEVWDGTNRALRVNTVAGSTTFASAVFGNAFPIGGIATGYQDANAAFASVTSTNGLPISAMDTQVASKGLGALNDTISIQLAGQVGAVFQVASAGTAVYTVTPECSFDGGSNYPIAAQMTDPSTGLDSATKNITNGQALTPYTVVCPFGASHARMRVSIYTSGTANWTARATVGGFPNSVPTLLTAAPTLSSANTATTITLNGSSGQRVCVSYIAMYGTGGAAGNPTVTLQDGATVVLDLGVASLLTTNNIVTFTGTPLLCGSSGNNIVINVGAGGTSVITHTSVVADRA